MGVALPGFFEPLKRALDEMSTTYDTRRIASEMSCMKQAKYECRHYTRKVWVAMFVAVFLIIGLGMVSRAVYQHGKAVQHANDSR